jgi:hypothetical protein
MHSFTAFAAAASQSKPLNFLGLEIVPKNTAKDDLKTNIVEGCMITVFLENSLLMSTTHLNNYILHCRKLGLYCPEIGFVARVHILQPKGPRGGGGPEGCNNCTSATKPIEGNNGALQMQFVV